ncbi:hypothetical protein [Paenibacillus ehimensis]|nr:hypothetical protein [Paenibacillus ehimensis]
MSIRIYHYTARGQRGQIGGGGRRLRNTSVKRGINAAGSEGLGFRGT